MAKAKTKAPKRVSKVPADESKAAKFTRLAQQRVTKALKAIKQITNLSGAGYESTEEQREKIITVLTEGVSAVRDSFAGKSKAQTDFKL